MYLQSCGFSSLYASCPFPPHSTAMSLERLPGIDFLPLPELRAQSEEYPCGGETRLCDIITDCPPQFAEWNCDLPQGRALRRGGSTNILSNLWPYWRLTPPASADFFVLTPSFSISLQERREEPSNDSFWGPDGSFCVEGTSLDRSSPLAIAQARMAGEVELVIACHPSQSDLTKLCRRGEFSAAAAIYDSMFRFAIESCKRSWLGEGWSVVRVSPDLQVRTGPSHSDAIGL